MDFNTDLKNYASVDALISPWSRKILHRPWNRLFTKKEKEVAIARLKTFGYEFDHGEIIDLEDEG